VNRPTIRCMAAQQRTASENFNGARVRQPFCNNSSPHSLGFFSTGWVAPTAESELILWTLSAVNSSFGHGNPHTGGVGDGGAAATMDAAMERRIRHTSSSTQRPASLVGSPSPRQNRRLSLKFGDHNMKDPVFKSLVLSRINTVHKTF
jgi:hypothetical protein